MTTRRSWMMAAAAQPPKFRVIDAHNHLHHHARADWAAADRQLVDAADRLGIDQLCCSIVPLERPATLEGCRDANRWMAEATRRFPGRVLGYCFVNPGHGAAALEEIRRYVEREGFIGIKLYNDHRVTDPVVAPVLELAARLRVPVLQHAGHTSWLPSPQPRISDAGDVAQAARAFPETLFICAHFCGGGDWEWSLKALRGVPNAWFDSSGSVADEGTVEFAVKVLGAERVLFGTDLSLTASVGRIRGAALSETDRRKLLGGNMAALLARRSA